MKEQKNETQETVITPADSIEGPTVEALKERFKEGSIPLQTDFSDLIDLAEHGRRAVGKSAGQSGPGYGLELTEQQDLKVKANDDYGIKADKNGVSAKIGYGLAFSANGNIDAKANAGIITNNDGISVKANTLKGIEIDKEGVAVKANTLKGIEIDKEGVAVKANTLKGIEVDKDGVYLKLADNHHGLETDSNGNLVVREGYGLVIGQQGHLDVAQGYGIKVNQLGVNIKVTSDGGLRYSDAGVYIKGNQGINVDEGGVSVKLYPDYGLVHNSGGIYIKVNRYKGISVDQDGLYIKAGSGLDYSGGGNINVLPGKGLTVGVGMAGVSVKADKERGVDVDEKGVYSYPNNYSVIAIPDGETPEGTNYQGTWYRTHTQVKYNGIIPEVAYLWIRNDYTTPRPRDDNNLWVRNDYTSSQPCDDENLTQDTL